MIGKKFYLGRFVSRLLRAITMLNSQRKIRLGDYVVHQKGFAFKSSQYTSVGHPIIRVSNFTDRSVDISDLYFTSDSVQQYEKFKVRCFDVVIATVGSWPANPASIVGKTVSIPPECEGALLNQNAVILRGMNGLEQKYLFYLLKTNEFQEYIVSKAQGSANQASITLDDIFGFEFELPTLEYQKFVISQLRTIDEKIELNRKMNETLEAVAQALFKSWFVDFEPWYGEKPVNWREGTLGQCVTIKRGGSPRPIQDYLSDTGLRWLKISDVTSLQSPFVLKIKEHIKESGLRKTVFLESGSLVLSNSATPGIPKILCVDTCIHDGWLYFPVSLFSNEYLYLFFKHIRQNLVALGNGSIFTNLKTDILKNYLISVPDAQTLQNFDKLVMTLFEAIENRVRESATLVALHDILLPKLISGQLCIKDAEKFLESHI